MKRFGLIAVSILLISGCSETVRQAKSGKPPKAVKEFSTIDANGKPALCWVTPASDGGIDYYSVNVRRNLDAYQSFNKHLTNSFISLSAMESENEYTFLIVAVGKNGKRSPAAEYTVYLCAPQTVLAKNAAVTGNVVGLGKAKGIVMLYPVNLGEFGDYDVSPVRVNCDAEGRFSFEAVAAGTYTIKAFADIDGNGEWDGNWLGKTPEPTVTVKDIRLEDGKSAQLAMTVRTPTTGLPEPIYDEHPEYVTLYNAAWSFAREKISTGKTENGFVSVYMDEGFNNHIYQWDTCFMMLFGVYGGNEFPAMNSVDNFYRKQRPSGYICRVQNEDTGKDYNPTKLDPNINPPLFTWVEYNYYRITGDNSRILWALSHNHRYFKWLKRNCRTKEGYYFTSNLGSGMDNSPREGSAYGWIDTTAQMALFAGYMEKLATIAGLDTLSAEYKKETEELKTLINAKMWDQTVGLYFDVKRDGTLHIKKTIASFWPMLALVCDTKQAARMVEHLMNPAEFATPHLFPTLAKDEPEYDSKGYYWRGAVWAPTEMMAIKGLEACGYDELAYTAAVNHISNMSAIYERFVPKKEKLPYGNPNIPFPAELDGTKQIWESYSSELGEPSTRWDNQYYVRPKFVGWSGDGPIAMFIENVIGIRLDAPDGKIVWTIRTDKRCGLKHFLFNGKMVSLTMTGIEDGEPAFEIESETAFTLEMIYKGKKIVKQIEPTEGL